MCGISFLSLFVALAASASPADERLPSPDNGIYRDRMLSWNGSAEPATSIRRRETDFLHAPVLNAPVLIDRTSSTFGMRTDPVNGSQRAHLGIDIPKRQGTPVRAAASGVVLYAGVAGTYGKLVEIDHAGHIQTRYAHLLELTVRSGNYVNEGTVIGFVGSTGRSTGSHLHFEVRQSGQAINPVAMLGQTVGVEEDEVLRARPASPKEVAPRWNWDAPASGTQLPTATIR